MKTSVAVTCAEPPIQTSEQCGVQKGEHVPKINKLLDFAKGHKSAQLMMTVNFAPMFHPKLITALKGKKKHVHKCLVVIIEIENVPRNQ